jgi:DNA-directed RNA polymerase subunit P
MDEQGNTNDPELKSGPDYECVRCGRRVNFKELEEYISFRCPFCGYRIFRKVRAPIVKHLKAR